MNDDFKTTIIGQLRKIQNEISELILQIDSPQFDSNSRTNHNPLVGDYKMSWPDPNATIENIVRCICQGAKLEGIKHFRMRYGVGLKEAKDACDYLQNHSHLCTPITEYSARTELARHVRDAEDIDTFIREINNYER